MSAASADLSQLAKDLHYAAGMGIEKAAHKVVADTAKKTQALAMSYAPVDTGLLSRTILIKWETRTRCRIYPLQSYGVYQEFGTGERGEFEGSARPSYAGGQLKTRFKVQGRKVVAYGGATRGVPPHPFMRPAIVQALGPAAADLAKAGALLVTKGPKAVQAA